MPIRYANQGKKRNLRLAADLEKILSESADEFGFDIVVASGGQEPGKGTGSNRHDHGHAGDVDIFDRATGKQLIPTNPEHQRLLAPFMTRLVEKGVTSIGAGEGYMGGTRFHIDNAQAYGQGVEGARYWGKSQSKDSAPDWLKSAVDQGYSSVTNAQPIPVVEQNAPQRVEVPTYVEPVPVAPAPNVETPIDYSLWNPFGWREGTNLSIDQESQGVSQAVSTLLGQNSPLAVALQTVINQETRRRKKDVNEEVENSTPWLQQYMSSSRPERASRPSRRRQSTGASRQVTSIGDWTAAFKQVEDPGSKFNHGNGAYGSFGYRKTGHLQDAFNSSQFSEIRKQYGDYSSFWKEFTSGGYGGLSQEVDRAYEGWLKDKTGNDFDKAAKFNYAGYAGLNKSDEYVPENNQISLGEYRDRALRENGGWLLNFKEPILDYKIGEIYDIEEEEIEKLKHKGYEFKYL